MQQFQAYVLREIDNKISGNIELLDTTSLPERDVVIKVVASSLNYKDGLAITGKGRIIRSYPMVPGIDLAGVVERSHVDRFEPGDKVLVTGWGVGEQHWGGYSERAAMAAEWVTPLPATMSFDQAMGFGTAGLTAMLCVQALERHDIDPNLPVLVTGAAGGVGSVAVAILARLGYQVVASTGRQDLAEYLKAIGAETVLDRAELAAAGKPLATERWGGVVDTVGGQTLASALAATAYRGTVAACGLAGGAEFNATVMPFILRGVTLAGIDSVRASHDVRNAAWARLGEIFPQGLPADMVETISLEELPSRAAAILGGGVKGRVIVRLG